MDSLRTLLAAVQLLSLAFATRWPYLQMYPPVNESDSRTPLHFALMLSTSGFRSITVLPGVQIALDYINSEPSILPGYTLHYTLSDSQCDPSVTVAGVFQQLQQSPTKLGWLGSGCLTATEFSAPLTQLYNITQISCVTSSPIPNDRAKLKYYFQLQPLITVLNRGLIGLLNKYGWKRVGLITWRDSYFSMIADHFKELMTESNIEFSERLVSTAGFEVNGDPFDADKRIYVLILAPIQARQLLCEAYQRGLGYPKNQFLLIGEYTDTWLREPNPARDLGCSLEQRQDTLGFSLTVNLPDNPQDDVTIPYGGLSAGLLSTTKLKSVLQRTVSVVDGVHKLGKKTAARFREEFFRQARRPENEEINLAEFVRDMFPLFAPSCHEATLALAFALHNTSEDLKTNRTLNREAGRVAGQSEGETFTLANFTYSNTAIVQRMFYHLNRTNFLGISGNIVQFQEDGIRNTDYVVVTQYTPGHVDEEGFYHMVGSVFLSDGSNEVSMVENVSESIYWPEGVPNDGTPIQNIVTVSPALTAMYSLISVAGLILAFACAIFNFVHRNKKLIRLSSPKLNYIIILGAILFYISGIFLVLPSLDPNVIIVHCNLTPVMVFTGYSMCYGTILVKMFRVWYIFNHPSLQKKYIITDCYLMCLVGAFVGLDLVMMLTFISVQGFRNQLVATLAPSAEHPRILVGPTEVVQENYAYACNVEGRGALIILLYISKILLQIISLILAFRTRKVKVKGLDDSKYISAAIYITTIVLPLSVFASFTLRSHVNAFPAIVGAAHYFGATAILLLVFVPRMVGLYKDPSGENVFQGKGHTLAQEESNVMSLRRDVQQLRVSLHLAQKKKKKGGISTEATENSPQEPAPQPKQAIVKPCIRKNSRYTENNCYISPQVHASVAIEENDEEITRPKPVGSVKPRLQFTESSSTEDNDYAHAQIVKN